MSGEKMHPFVLWYAIIGGLAAVLFMAWFIHAGGKAYDECIAKHGTPQRGLCISQDGRIIPLGVNK